MNTQDIDVQEFSDIQFFSSPPGSSCSKTLIDPSLLGGHLPDFTLLFGIFFKLVLTGSKILYNVDNVIQLEKPQIEVIRSYLRSVGVDPFIQANVNVTTKEILAWKISFKPLDPKLSGIESKFIIINPDGNVMD